MTSLHQSEEFSPTDAFVAEHNSSDKKAFLSNMPIQDRVKKRYEVAKSPNDNRLYRGLLLDNKMRILLISDPTTDKSAAALDVNIGYMSDPPDLQGLAHFCEHMLFLGTHKYPQENEYHIYLSQNGGSGNAATYMDHTSYYFDINPEKLEGALDRFAQFFIAPLFTESLTDLELNAVHSEHLKNLASDSWRIDQLDKSSANPDHPYSNFGTGSKETLDVIPKQKGINVRQRLLEFHDKYYSANIMSLCILGKESLDKLETMAVNLFSEVKNKEVELPVWPVHPFSKEDFQTKWYTVPIKDVRSLTIVFPIPDLRDHYKSAPVHYVSHLIGHEGKGSLLSALKTKGWCNSLMSGRRAAARGFSFMSVMVDLTEEGIQHVDDIIMLIFQYINMLKKEGPVEWIFKEYQDIAVMNFRFKEKSSPRAYVSSVVQSLQDYPMEHVLTAERLFTEWKPELINDVLKCLTPQNIRVHVLGKAFENITDESEKWYGTKYKKEKIPSETISKWADGSLNPDLKLPLKNEFIATKFDIKSQENNVNKFPVIIKDTSLLRVWYKQDDEYLVPKAVLTFDFVSPIAYIDPLSCNLVYMFVQLVRDSLNEYAYSADLAGLKWELSASKYGIMLLLGGYDHKQSVLLEKIMNRMVNFTIHPKRFEVLKENYIRSMNNFDTEQPYQHAVYYLTVLLSEHVWTKDELLEATSHLTIERVQKFIPQFLSKVHIECLIHGNVTLSEANDLVKIVESKLVNNIPDMVPLLPKQMVLYREVRLEDGCHFLYEIENHYHESSCAEVYYQTGMQSTETNMLLELLSQIISEPCFNTLRTKEQLGYIVFSGIRRTNGTQGLRIIVQSDRHPNYVEQRVDEFLNTMMAYIQDMTEEDFNKHKESLVTQRLEKPKMLNSRSAIFWNEISTQQYNFDRVNIEVAYLKTITKAQIEQFFKENIFHDTRHKLSVHVISMAENGAGLVKDDKKNKISSAKKIDDILSFKISQHLFPLLKPFNDIPRKGARSSKL